MRDLDTSLLRTFVAVAERGSMTAGAAALNLTQGAVSQKIARLEQQAGGSLLFRRSRCLGLTPKGERLLGKARRMLALNDEIWTDMQGGSVDGPVRLGLPVDLAGLLIPVLKHFMAAFPRIQPQLSCSSSADIRKRMDAGEFDLALLEELTSDWTGECLAVEQLVWVGAVGGVAHRRDPLPICLVSDACCFRSQVMSALAASGQDVRTVLGNSGLDAAVATVKADIAVSVWLGSVLPPGLGVIGGDAALPPLPSYAITLHRPAQIMSPAAEELARHIRGKFVQP